MVDFLHVHLVPKSYMMSRNMGKPTMFVLFVCFDSLRPINNLSVMQGRVFLG